MILVRTVAEGDETFLNSCCLFFCSWFIPEEIAVSLARNGGSMQAVPALLSGGSRQGMLGCTSRCSWHQLSCPRSWEGIRSTPWLSCPSEQSKTGSLVLICQLNQFTSCFCVPAGMRPRGNEGIQTLIPASFKKFSCSTCSNQLTKFYQ